MRGCVDGASGRYARSGETSFAYQLFGRGEIDLLFAPGPASHLDLHWEHPLPARFLDRLGRFARVIMFDRRGMGLSDPVDRPPTYEQQVEAAVAVLDAAGMTRVAVLASSEAGHMAAMLAATRPARVTSLVLISPAARAAREIRADAARAALWPVHGHASRRRVRRADRAGGRPHRRVPTPWRGSQWSGDPRRRVDRRSGARRKVLCSSTVKDLVIGSGMRFDDRGEHVLKGVAGGAWRLYALSDSRDPRDT
jgi:pimeloyl-ACP methyl ester carboxylesterase